MTSTPHPTQVCSALAIGAALTVGAALVSSAYGQPICQARSGTATPVVVELYTSEGCSSCPPADRWLSTLKGKPDVMALAFHVNYWDRLGWPDRFASAEATARQHEIARLAGSRQVYTPQVVAQGQDWRAWPKLPPPKLNASGPVSLTLMRDGDTVTAQVAAQVGAAREGASQLSGYWAVVEDQHLTKVRAGENAGETLRHDHVVRLYQPVAAWSAAQGFTGRLMVNRGVPEYPRRVVFVVTEAASQRPVQALALPC